MTKSQLHVWEKTSLDSVADTHPVLPLIASLLLGIGVLASTSSLPAASCSALMGCSMSISRAMRSAKQYDSIRKYGCYSISLDETLLAEYIRVNGMGHTKAEIIWAQESGLMVSEACENLIDGTTDAIPKRLSPEEIMDDNSTLSRPIAQQLPVELFPSTSLSVSTFPTANISTHIPQSQKGWEIADMVSDIDNRLILGLKGSGKTVLVGKMLELVRQKFPDKRIFVIDPKADQNERDIYRFADDVYSGNIGEMTKEEGLQFIQEGFKRYINHDQPGLLIVDEAIMIGGCMSDNKSNFLESKLRYVVAGGDSRGLNCWLISQSPMLADLGLKTGVSSQLNLTIIATKSSLPNIKAWSNGSLMAGVVVEDALPAIANCLIPKGRAVLSGGFWYPMPVIETMWNRDERVMNPVVNPHPIDPNPSEPTIIPPEPIDIPLNPLEPNYYDTEPIVCDRVSLNPIENPEEPSKPSDKGMLERMFMMESFDEPTIDNILITYFYSAKNHVPKTVRELRKIRSIAGTGASPELVKQRLDKLTEDGKLIQKDKGWVLPGW